MKRYVIIVAGGSGSRMRAPIPKQFLELNRKYVLQYSIEAFYRYNPHIEIVVSMHPAYIDGWQSLCEMRNLIPHRVVKGGKTRFHSVRNALLTLPDSNALVAVHDAARPLIYEDFIRRLFDEAETFGSSVPVMPLTQSVRRITPSENVALDRSLYFTVQTPQIFPLRILQNAYKQAYRSGFTDDASICEAAGYPIHTVPGIEQNIKITNMQDFRFAGILLESFPPAKTGK